MSKTDAIKMTRIVMSSLAGVNKATIGRKIVADDIQSLPDSLPNRKAYGIEAIRKVVGCYIKQKKSYIQKKVHTFYNFKGGTGKTSLCYQVASHLVFMGYNVLTIDMDPQAHLSSLEWFSEEEEYPTIYDVLINGEPIENTIKTVFSGLDAIPSNLLLTKLEILLSAKTRRETLLSKVIEPLKERYDFILIDTNPTISITNMNALIASDQINIITETHPLSLHGLGILIEEQEFLFREMELPFNYRIIANKYESKTATAQEVLGVLRSDYRESVCRTVVRKSEDINIASKKHLPISIFSNKKSPAFEDIIDLTREIIDMSIKNLELNAA